MKVKRITSALIAMAISISTLSAFAVSATTAEDAGFKTQDSFENDEEYYSYMMNLGGCLPDDENSDVEVIELTNESTNKPMFANSKSPIDDAVDLRTETDYFPPILNQVGGSCASYSAAYYQFTYEAHRYNNIKTTSENAYSPRWTFNFTNRGLNAGASLDDVYKVLKNQGAVTIKDYTCLGFDGKNFNSFFEWCKNEQAMIDALGVRVAEEKKFELDTYNDKIYTSSDSRIMAIKRMLYDGKVLTVTEAMGDIDDTKENKDKGNWSCKTATNGERVAYRAAKPKEGGHAMTIVGYDDNIQYDVNRNGKIEACEKGAFKVVNSWGTGWENGGCIWVLYDALNIESANTANNWEKSEKGTRVSIFDLSGGSKNKFYSIDVKNYDVNLAAVLNFNTNDRHNIELRSGINNSFNNNDFIFSYNRSQNQSYSGPFVLSFGDKDSNIRSRLTGTNWFVKLTNRSGATSPITNVSYKIVDNKDNVIENKGKITNSISAGKDATSSIKLNMQYGDVDYDKSLTTADAQLVLKIVTGSTIPSNMQKVLADYDKDGEITPQDAQEILKVIVGL